jgi:hypothetical protein
MQTNLQPLERLLVRDGLLLNAERWQRSHDYHRQRQNLLTQALYQPGIVSGLGVTAIAAPDKVAAQYRDGRWLQIQNGFAIDGLGNPIIVDSPLEFRLATVTSQQPVTVYLVLSYVDPETLRRREAQEFVPETFRIDEKTSPARDSEIERCLVQLQPGQVSLRNAQNPFYPAPNTLDLRYRDFAQLRETCQFRVVYLTREGETEAIYAQNLGFLLRSLRYLCPHLATGQPPIALNLSEKSNPIDCDLVYMTYAQLQGLSDRDREHLQAYMAQGSTLYIEVADADSNLETLKATIEELQTAIADVKEAPQYDKIRRDLAQELSACQGEYRFAVTRLSDRIQAFAQTLGCGDIGSNGEITADHPLRQDPFLFAQWPKIDNLPLEFLAWNGIVVGIGPLSSGWGIEPPRSREIIRTAQEMGVNLLYFAWRRRYLLQLSVNSHQSSVF